MWVSLDVKTTYTSPLYLTIHSGSHNEFSSNQWSLFTVKLSVFSSVQLVNRTSFYYPLQPSSDVTRGNCIYCPSQVWGSKKRQQPLLSLFLWRLSRSPSLSCLVKGMEGKSGYGMKGDVNSAPIFVTLDMWLRFHTQHYTTKWRVNILNLQPTFDTIW